ncbi:Phospho-N-acetylmuramoyl-pentapeptidetransferase [Gloeomargarita lithophora Alchichica-D10]|uniref:Phospho-N-acetylmuramoyl-pentapeptide-transferase n=1 Tax=Gloeomargarita lithophora Alchichica-D10 TaxID=1188229 RepID=A0A1J0AAE1_9CYAN|nr:phospho-N-acetylmuramoyl-pentapeptide-transferase [Gloeomargarita lithophora]APB32877.1 Phospho-N-acetylmuramoyl-pentapeptidetransferase [Gloeomargarita lithophora Alchichica-D10]
MTPPVPKAGAWLVVGLAVGLLMVLGGIAPNAPVLLLTLGLATGGTAGLGAVVLPWLRRLKMGQIIRREGPQAHLKKAGTPTMGGIFFLPVVPLVTVLILLLQKQTLSGNAWAVIALTLACGAIGGLDDWLILQAQSNQGLAPRAKLALQILAAVGFTLWLWWQGNLPPTIAFPWGMTLNLGLGFWVLVGFVPVAQSNAVNLTDGLDGLAAGTCAVALAGLGVACALTHPEVSVLAVAMAGACLGFLVHNHHPARVFMGDTGSLALGGALAGIGIVTQQLWLLWVLSLLFVWETLSVMAQVFYFKATKGPDGVGKRLFKMTPYHHHLELSGWSETQIVACFWGIEALLWGGWWWGRYWG